MGVTIVINLIENCEGKENASYFRYLPVARTNLDRHRDSRVIVVVSCDRDGTYIWHHSFSRGHIDFGPAFDGTDISGRAGYKTRQKISALGLVRLHHTGCHRPFDVRFGSYQDVYQHGLPD